MAGKAGRCGAGARIAKRLYEAVKAVFRHPPNFSVNEMVDLESAKVLDTPGIELVLVFP